MVSKAVLIVVIILVVLFFGGLCWGCWYFNQRYRVDINKKGSRHDCMEPHVHPRQDIQPPPYDFHFPQSSSQSQPSAPSMEGV